MSLLASARFDNLISELEEAPLKDEGLTYVMDASEARVIREDRRRFLRFVIFITVLIALLGIAVYLPSGSIGFLQWRGAMWLVLTTLAVHAYLFRMKGKWTIAADQIQYISPLGHDVSLKWSTIRRIKLGDGWFTLEGDTGTIRFPDRPLQPHDYWIEETAILRKRLRAHFDLTFYDPPPNSWAMRIISFFAQAFAAAVFLLGMPIAVELETKLNGWAGVIMIGVTAFMMTTVVFFQDQIGTAKFRRLNWDWRLPRERSEGSDELIAIK